MAPKKNDKNFPSTGPAIAPGVHINLADAYDSIQKIKQIADLLLPLHDPSIGTRKTIPKNEVSGVSVQVSALLFVTETWHLTPEPPTAEL